MEHTTSSRDTYSTLGQRGTRGQPTGKARQKKSQNWTGEGEELRRKEEELEAGERGEGQSMNPSVGQPASWRSKGRRRVG
ncbi:hypothetical protein V492_07512 [Pseudogymnoascus sp. VKM F-4246]|nr:hypothetical protein V492_07512 [Pseudogymnoascus sp. VKM F-4246]